jgi:hypothetical protein
MSVSTSSTGSISAGARAGGSEARANMAGVSAAAANVDNVNVFTKFIKKAEEAAQFAL